MPPERERAGFPGNLKNEEKSKEERRTRFLSYGVFRLNLWHWLQESVLCW